MAGYVSLLDSANEPISQIVRNCGVHVI